MMENLNRLANGAKEIQITEQTLLIITPKSKWRFLHYTYPPTLDLFFVFWLDYSHLVWLKNVIRNPSGKRAFRISNRSAKPNQTKPKTTKVYCCVAPVGWIPNSTGWRFGRPGQASSHLRLPEAD